MKLKILLLSALFLTFAFANAQSVLSQVKPTSLADAEAIKLLSNPTNQKNTELVMSVLKSIDDMNIKDQNKKIDFVNSLGLSEHIKNWVISEIKNNLSYSDYKKIGYGIYEIKNNKCSHFKSKLKINNPVPNPVPDHINLKGVCMPLEYYNC